MRSNTRLLLVGLAASILLAAAASSVSANKLSLRSRTPTFRVVWEPLEFSNTATATIVRCPVTLEGSFHSGTFEKVRGALIGHVTRAAVTVANCMNGQVSIPQETLPWPILYGAFTGDLPAIETLIFLVTRATFLITIGTATCRSATEATHPARLIFTVRESLKLIRVRADETAQIPLTNGPGGIGCELARGMLAGTTETIGELTTGTQLSIKLI